MSNQHIYNKAALKYRPDKIRTLFIAESPPAFDEEKGKSYFFFEENPGGDILFATLVKALYDIDYRKRDGNKAQLLRRMQKDHFWLIDAVEYPINRKDGRVVSEAGRVYWRYVRICHPCSGALGTCGVMESFTAGPGLS